MIAKRRLLLAFLPLGLLGLLPPGCGADDEKLTDANGGGGAGLSPPTGTGGFDPGDGGPQGQGANCGAGASTSSGSGASSGCNKAGSGGSSGSGGTSAGGTSAGGGDAGGEPEPPMCADELKRCPHEFTLAAGSESMVELRGSFAPGAWTMGVPMTKKGSTWSVTVDVPWKVDVQYKFYVDGKTWLVDPANPKKVADGSGGENSVLTGLTCGFWSCDVPAGTFDWRDAVLYFVFVDRFVDGDPSNNGAPVAGVQPAANYQGGDWKGVLSKIQDGYFTDLGINALWLTVPLDNPDEAGIGVDKNQYSAYHGYWPSDLDKPEARFGTMAELKAVVDAAHAKNIKVILDYAMNHVHKSSPVYAQHKDWFWPLDYNGKNCVCGEGCSWDDAYEARRCWFRDYLPDFDFTKQAARDFSVGNAVQWAKDTGIDGFRLDAVKHIEESWVTDLRARVKAEIEPTTKGHFYMVGETFTGDRDTIKHYVDPVTKLDGQFDFPLRMKLAETMLMRKGTLGDLDAFLGSNDAFYGSGVMSTFIGNHDIPRSIHLAEDTPLWSDPWTDGKDKSWSGQPGLPGGLSAFQRLANAFSLLMTTKGVPLVYYGDEIGMPGAGDPDNRRMMQWSGYSDGQKLLYAHIKKLTAIRAAHPALRKGTRAPLGATADTIAYTMTYQADTVTVVINRSDGDKSVSGVPSGALTDLLTGAAVSGPTVNVPARSAVVLVAK